MSLRWRLGLVGAVVLYFAYLSAANFVPKEQRVESPFWPDDGLRLGLDLQGGFHWVLEVDLNVALERELTYFRGQIEENLKDEGVTAIEARVENERLTVLVPRAADLDKLREAADRPELEVVEEGERELTLALETDWDDEVRTRTMQQVLEVLRLRIDDPGKGIPDSVVTRQGRDRVLVQVPGGQIDRERLRLLVIQTGHLEFKIVQDQAETRELLLARHGGVVPPEHAVVFEKDRETGRELRAYLVRETADITGSYLADARVGFDRQQRPIVNFEFTPEGGEIFAELTSANIGAPLAIILDDNVYSAPSIRSRIGSRGEISGRFTSQEAADLAVVLRAGALPVPATIAEERTVGPALGQDSIDRGSMASIVGLVLVVAFAVGYYRLSGGYAAVALACNLVLLIGLMSLAQATLTLPGIAGLVLTVGMAIDANVIIFERIREELRSGKVVRAAISTGFQKATSAVLDANITTLITAVVLYEFGSGPIKGFAVTLSVGIITSVFAALVITRLLFHLHPGQRAVQQLSI
ncbi:MAG: protein translocase subunit SecD [Proteobacteria bacterium]|nr:protein translocase subunit SecD [Pseudomonadota bacterium]